MASTGTPPSEAALLEWLLSRYNEPFSRRRCSIAVFKQVSRKRHFRHPPVVGRAVPLVALRRLRWWLVPSSISDIDGH